MIYLRLLLGRTSWLRFKTNLNFSNPSSRPYALRYRRNRFWYLPTKGVTASPARQTEILGVPHGVTIMLEELQERIGLRIRQFRRQLNLSVEQLAAQSDVDGGTISRAENGLTQITLDSAIRICRALSISLTELVLDEHASSYMRSPAGDRRSQCRPHSLYTPR